MTSSRQDKEPAHTCTGTGKWVLAEVDGLPQGRLSSGKVVVENLFCRRESCRTKASYTGFAGTSGPSNLHVVELQLPVILTGQN